MRPENIPMKWGISQFSSISSVFCIFIGFLDAKTVLEAANFIQSQLQEVSL